MEQNKATLKSRWTKLDGDRQQVLKRARQCSKLTIPSLLPDEGQGEDATLETPYQGLGARGVNNLASKLLMTLLPPNQPFFRLNIDDITELELEKNGQKAEVEEQLASIERKVMQKVSTMSAIVPTFEALKLDIVTGNALLFQPDGGGVEVYRLDEYVIKRNPIGEVLEIITKDEVDINSLPDNIQEQLIDKDEKLGEDLTKNDESFELYTRIVLNPEKTKWFVTQECNGMEIEEAKGSYPFDECPWVPLRWSARSNENYGRGLVEEYLGDFITLEALTKALTQGTVVASKILGLVNPNGVTRPNKLVKAKNGDFIEGRADDVSYLQLDKYMDYSLCYQSIEKIELRLKHAFLLMDAVQRQAERVTAEEIRTMARELETSLGGVYSLLSKEFQLPFVNRLMAKMKKAKELPDFPEDIVTPSVTTGMDALGRGHDLEKLMTFMQTLEPLGQDIIMTYLVPNDYMKRSATALGMEVTGLIRSEEEVQQMNEQAQMQQMASQMAPEVAKASAQPQQQEGGM